MLTPEAIREAVMEHYSAEAVQADEWYPYCFASRAAIEGVPRALELGYSKEELSQWAQRVKRMAKKADRIFILFNNCHLGQAAKDALALKELIAGG